MTPIPRELNLSRPISMWAGGDVRFRVSLSLGIVDGPDSPALWDDAVWDLNEWSAGGVGEAYWYDVTAYALRVSTSIGKDRFEEAFRTGRFSLTLDNQTGLWNPIAGQTPNYKLSLRPGRWFRIEGYTEATGWVPMFTGYVDSINDAYTGAGWGIDTIISGYGFAGTFQMDRLPPLEVPLPGGSLTSERIEWLLDRWGWPDDYRDIQAGVATMLPSDIPGSSLTEMQKAAEAEGGGVFFDQNAIPTFKAREWLKTDPRSTSLQYRIGGPGSDIDPLDFSVDWSAQRLYNDVQLTARDGVMQRATDTISWARYFRRTFTRTALENDNDVDVLELADRFLAAFAYDRIRIESVDVWPKDAVRGALALETRIGDLIEATVRTGAGWGYTAEAHVMRIDHVVTADDWEMSLRLDDSQTIPPPDAGSFDDGFDAGFRIGGS